MSNQHAQHHTLRGPERVHFEMHAKLILSHPEDEPPIPVVVRDISTDGAGVCLSRDLPGGTRLLLQLPAAGGTTLTLHAHVVQSRKLEPDLFRIGIQFDHQESAVMDRLRDALLL